MLISSHEQFPSLSLIFYSCRRDDSPFFKRQGNDSGPFAACDGLSIHLWVVVKPTTHK